MKKAILIMMLLIGTVTQANDDHLTVATIEHQEITEGIVGVMAPPSQLSGVLAEVETADQIVETVIGIGERVYDVADRGRPVVNVRTNKWDALPQINGNVPNVWSLENWSMPASRKFQVKMKNLYGITIVNFVYVINYTYGGSYNGQGKYLSSVEVRAESLEVAWGYTFEATTERVQVINHRTNRNPLAGMTVKLNYTVKTVLKETRYARSYHVRADGSFSKL